MNRDLRELQDKIGYQFQEWKLFRRAMTHSSFANEHHMDKLDCNERLELWLPALPNLAGAPFGCWGGGRPPPGGGTGIR